MSRTTSSNRKWWWAFYAVVLAVVLVIVPRPISTLVTDDSEHRWAGNAVPPQREIVWKPPVLVDLPKDADEPEVSLIRPQLTKRNHVLYLTQRTAEGVSNIFRSVLTDDGWQLPEPVEQLNSSANDVGPVIIGDGSKAYLYSDREGGFGGFDLYVSEMTDDGWSEPTNLGPTINTRANEYAPAVTSDGETLVFSSNRTKRMHRHTHKPQNDQEDWTVTLRAEQGMQQYDLYVSRRDEDAWPGAKPIEVLNKPRSNEGTPWFSSNSAWLYFASDREHRSNESPNYDLFRTRVIKNRFTDIENLGGDINTPANELDPSLSEDGFRMVFSSNRMDHAGDERDPDEIVYALYTSDATEVFHETVWSESRLPYFLQNWWWIVLGLIILGLLAALIYYIREASLKRAPVPVFFLIALLVHLLLVIGTGYVGFGVVKQFIPQIEEVFLPDNVEESSHQSHEVAQESYEKVSDLQSIEEVEVQEIIREIVEQPNVAVPNNRVAVNLPIKIVRRELPKEEVDVTPKKVTPTDFNPLGRRKPNVQMDQVAQIDPIEFDKTPLEKPQEQQPAQPDVNVDRTESEPIERPLPSPVKPNMAQNETPLEQDLPNENAESPMAKVSPIQDVKIARAERKLPDIESPMIETPNNNTPAPAPAKAEPQAEANVEVARRATDASSAVPKTAVPLENTKQKTADAQPEQFVAETFRSRPVRPDSSKSPVARIRQTDFAEQFIDKVDIPTGETSAASESDSMSDKVQTAEVVVEVNQSESGNATAPPKKQTDPNLNKLAEVGAEATATDSRSVVDQLAMLNTSRALNNPLVNRRRSQPTLDDAPLVEVPKSATANAGEPTDVTSDDSQVEVDRQATSPAATQRMAGKTVELPAKNKLNPSPTEANRSVELSTTPTQQTPLKNQLARAMARPKIGEPSIDVPVPSETPTEPGESDSKQVNPTGVEVGVERAEGEPLESNVKSANEVGGPVNTKAKADVGALASEKNDARPSFSTLASRLNRRPARAAETMYANDNVGLRAMFRVRQGEAKDLVFKAYGGDDASRQAINRGLTWFERHQFEDGHWSLNKFNQTCKSHPGSCNGHGTVNSDVAATGFALLPILGDGHTHQSGKYQAMVSRGLDWLLSGQKTTGELTRGSEGNGRMYSHAIATIALCEAYGMSQDEKLREPVERAVGFIITSQHKASGGWRYQPNTSADTSVVGWQVMALKSAQMAGIEVPKSCFDLVTKWLNKVEAKGKNRGQYGYTGPSPKLAMTAEAMLCREYLGASHDDTSLLMSAKHLLKHLPAQNKDDSYYWYYGTQAMFHLQGDYWKQWNGAIRDMLVKTQITTGVMQGTWNPRDNWERSGGRIYTTSLRMLILEAPYRHLPLYHMLGQ